MKPENIVKRWGTFVPLLDHCAFQGDVLISPTCSCGLGGRSFAQLRRKSPAIFENSKLLSMA